MQFVCKLAHSSTDCPKFCLTYFHMNGFVVRQDWTKLELSHSPAMPISYFFLLFSLVRVYLLTLYIRYVVHNRMKLDEAKVYIQGIHNVGIHVRGKGLYVVHSTEHTPATCKHATC